MSSQQYENTIEHGKLDKRFYEDIKDRSTEMKQSVSEASETVSTAKKLSEDIFYSLYQYSPQKRQKSEMRDAYTFNHDLIEKMTSLKEYEEIRTRTQQDEIQSSLSTVQFMKSLIKDLSDEELKELEEQQNNVQKREDKIKELEDNIEGLKSFEELDDKRNEALEKMEEEIEELRAEQGEALEEFEGNLELNSKKMRQMAKGCIIEAKDKAEKYSNILSGWGISTSSKEAKKMSVEDEIDLARMIQNNEKLMEMADMIGRMTRLAKSTQRRKTHKTPEFIEEIEAGNDIPRVIPSELGTMGMDDAEILFFKKYAEEELLQYNMKGYEDKGKGAMVVCVDTSGSMSGIKETWAKAVALALYNVARRQNRPYRAINFSAKGQYKTYDISTDNGVLQAFKRKGKTDRNTHDTTRDESVSLIELLEDSFGSGTDFDTPLEEGMSIIETDEDYEKADMVFITDGRAKTSQETLDELQKIKDKIEFQIIGIGVEDMAGGLDEFCDSVFNLSDIRKEGMDTAQNVFELI